MRAVQTLGDGSYLARGYPPAHTSPLTLVLGHVHCAAPSLIPPDKICLSAPVGYRRSFHHPGPDCLGFVITGISQSFMAAFIGLGVHVSFSFNLHSLFYQYAYPDKPSKPFAVSCSRYYFVKVQSLLQNMVLRLSLLDSLLKGYCDLLFYANLSKECYTNPNCIP